VIYALLGLALLLILLLTAMRLGAGRARAVRDEDPVPSVISASGVYSIVRRSPREAVAALEPTEPQIRQYLRGINEDKAGTSLSDSDKERLVDAFLADRESNVAEVEKGDVESVDFYYYDHRWPDAVCEKHVSKGSFVTREDIFSYPRLVPPFHLGCGCQLRRQHGTDNVRKTIALRFHPLIRDDSSPPELPDWREVIRIP
jgi:hypothetical protein